MFIQQTPYERRHGKRQLKRQSQKSPLFLYGGTLFFLGLVVFSISSVIGQLKGPDSSGEKSLTAGVTEVVQAAPDPYRVGIQAGHWKTDELPDELGKLWWNGGASAGGYNEWEVNLDIAQAVAEKLEAKGIKVDVLPATVPAGYKADVFITIHADGNEDTTVSGYKVAGSEWDDNGEATKLSNALDEAYGEATGMEENPTITDDMTQYYAFNHYKYVHSIHPSTPGAIVEVGFITNFQDRRTFIGAQEKSVAGIANGILDYLEVE